MPMTHVRLELARDHENPAGSRDCGYEFVAPLDNAGGLDAQLWKKHRRECSATRFWAGQKPEIGHLIRKPGGAWAFHYDVFGDEDDDETGYRFGDEKFVEGEYVSIKEHDDAVRTFRVVSVRDA